MWKERKKTYLKAYDWNNTFYSGHMFNLSLLPCTVRVFFSFFFRYFEGIMGCSLWSAVLKNRFGQGVGTLKITWQSEVFNWDTSFRWMHSQQKGKGEGKKRAQQKINVRQAALHVEPTLVLLQYIHELPRADTAPMSEHLFNVVASFWPQLCLCLWGKQGSERLVILNAQNKLPLR